MATVAFDTLKFATTLKEAGVPEKQAEAQARAFAEIMEVNLDKLATKVDLGEVRKEVASFREEVKKEFVSFREEVKKEFTTLREEIKKDSTNLEKKIEQDFAQAKSDLRADLLKINGEQILIRWMFGAMLTVMVAILIRMFFAHPF